MSELRFEWKVEAGCLLLKWGKELSEGDTFSLMDNEWFWGGPPRPIKRILRREIHRLSTVGAGFSLSVETEALLMGASS